MTEAEYHEYVSPIECPLCGRTNENVLPCCRVHKQLMCSTCYSERMLMTGKCGIPSPGTVHPLLGGGR